MRYAIAKRRKWRRERDYSKDTKENAERKEKMTLLG